MGGVLLNKARRVLVPAATHDETNCSHERPRRRAAPVVGAPGGRTSSSPHKHCANYPLQKDRGKAWKISVHARIY